MKKQHTLLTSYSKDTATLFLLNAVVNSVHNFEEDDEESFNKLKKIVIIYNAENEKFVMYDKLYGLIFNKKEINISISSKRVNEWFRFRNFTLEFISMEEISFRHGDIPNYIYFMSHNKPFDKLFIDDCLWLDNIKTWEKCVHLCKQKNIELTVSLSCELSLFKKFQLLDGPIEIEFPQFKLFNFITFIDQPDMKEPLYILKIKFKGEMKPFDFQLPCKLTENGKIEPFPEG